jgi:tRNA(adenine34) deaminase
MHRIDEGPQDAPLTWLLLHGNPTWSYLWRHFIPPLLAAGHRVVAPDLMGFGKSDKPKKDEWHRFTHHRQVLLELIEALNLQRVVLVVQDWGGIFGLTLPVAQPHRFVGLWALNTWLATADRPLTPGFLAWRQMCRDKPGFDIGRLMQRARADTTTDEARAYNAPFPDLGHRAATRVFAELLPQQADQDGAEVSRQARRFWQEHWNGRSLMTIGAADPVLGESPMRHLQGLVRHMPEPQVLPDVGHFVPDCGQASAESLVAGALNHFKTLQGAV